MTADTQVKAAFAALLGNCLDTLRAALASGMDVNAPASGDVVSLDPKSIAPGDRLLHLALWRENRDAVEILLRFNPDIGIASRDGVTPLQMAIGRGMEDIAVWFLEAGASALSTDHCGLSPIHYARTPGLLSALLDRGVPVDLLAQSTHWTPLHYAAYHNDLDKADVLLRHGASVKAQGRRGETPLHLLAALRYRDVQALASRLVSAGADVNAQDDDGNTPLHWAVGVHQDQNWMDRGNPDAVGCYLDHGADPQVRNRQGQSPIRLAFRSADAAYRQAFLAHGLKPRIADSLRVVYPGAVRTFGVVFKAMWIYLFIAGGVILIADEYWHPNWAMPAMKWALLPVLFLFLGSWVLLFVGAIVEALVCAVCRSKHQKNPNKSVDHYVSPAADGR